MSSEEDEEMTPVVRLETIPAQIDLSLVKSHFVSEGKYVEEDCDARVVVNYRDDSESRDIFSFGQNSEKAEEVYEEIADARGKWEEKVAEKRKELMDTGGQSSLGFGG